MFNVKTLEQLTYLKNPDTGVVDTQEGWEANRYDKLLHGLVDVINQNSQWFDFEVAVNLMDDDVKILIHSLISRFDSGIIVTTQLFFDLYCSLHFGKYGERFILN